MLNLKKISVIIPCFNEVNTISKIIQSVEQCLVELKLNFEIIVIDDCSNDGSILKLEDLEKNKKIILLKHEKNYGKGSAIKTGLNKVRGDIVIIQDSDLEYNPIDFKKLLLPFYEADADVVYGSRFLGGDRYVRIHFFWHYLANKILTFLCNVATNLNLTDMETGYKVFKTNKISNINIQEKSFGVEPELTIKLAKKKCKFFEVPISYNGRNYDEGKKIKLIDAFIAVYCIFKYSLFK